MPYWASRLCCYPVKVKDRLPDRSWWARVHLPSLNSKKIMAVTQGDRGKRATFLTDPFPKGYSPWGSEALGGDVRDFWVKFAGTQNILR